MAWYFFDTSALIRRYRRSEPGGARVVRLCQPSSGHLIVIARVTPVEIASALNRLGREGHLAPEEVGAHWASFRRHSREQYQLVDVGHHALNHAAELLFRQPLRAYDAVQLAVALQVRVLSDLVTNLRFCTADQRQAVAGTRLGLTVELIA